jgi:hypothetical protein
MRKTMLLAAAVTILTSVWGCGSKEETKQGAGAPEAAANTASAAPAASAAPTAAAAATASTPATETTPAAVATGSGAPAAVAATTGSAAAAAGSAATGPKTFDCGAKGQKACPMQGWMKSVMGSASSSGDGEKLSSALSYVAGKAPPGMGNWSSIASAGAAKAKSGDIDGAKATCKKCHDLYKDKYQKTMRDRPW